MSPRDTFKEEVYDFEHKPLLNYVINHLLGFSIDKNPNFEEPEEFYNGWRDIIEYMVLQKQEDGLRFMGEINRETIEMKSSKRGNHLLLACC